MIFLLVMWLILGGSWLAIGLGILNLLKVQFEQSFAETYSLAILLGMSATGLLWYAIAFFLPLSVITAGSTVLILLLLSRPAWQPHLVKGTSHLDQRSLFIVGAIAILVSAFLNQPITAYDTGLYHHQVIKWLAQVGAVPGLALIHYAYGYESAWLALSAPLQSLLPERSDTVISGLTIMMVLLRTMPILARIHHQRSTFTDWFWLLSMVLCLGILCSLELPISPSPDVGVSCLTLFMTHELVQQISKSPTLRDGVPVGLAIAAFACKLTALPLVLITTLWFGIRHRHQLRTVLLMLGCVGLAISPLLIFGLRTTGCPLYPSSLLCWPHFPWSFSTDIIHLISTRLQDCARWLCPPAPPAVYGVQDWLIPWSIKQKRAVFLFIFNLCILGYLTFKDSSLSQRRYWPIWFIVMSGMFLIFTRSPSIRFGVLYLHILPAFWVAELCHQRSPWRFWAIWLIALGVNLWLNPSITLWLLLLILVLVSGVIWRFNQEIHASVLVSLCVTFSMALTLRTNLAIADYQTAWLYPPAIVHARPAKLISVQMNNVTYLTPDPTYQWIRENGAVTGEDRCWSAPIPCTPELMYDDIQLRVPKQGLGGGFIRKMTPLSK